MLEVKLVSHLGERKYSYLLKTMETGIISGRMDATRTLLMRILYLSYLKHRLHQLQVQALV